MIRKKISELKGGEILAKPLMTQEFQVILPAGATLRKEYIQRIFELGIMEVFIKEEEASNEIMILKTEVRDHITEKVKDVLQRHTYHHNSKELSVLAEAADNIITNILEEEQVIDKVFDIKERSNDIYEHSINVCSMAILTALKMQLNMLQIHDIGVGCLLHDIGLRYISADYSEKQVEMLSRNERMEFMKHPVYGYTSLSDESWISDLSKILVLHHHERMDGTGYPLRIKKIPLECSIVNVCDTFDEMICGITCEKVKVHEAIEYLKSFRDIKFDKEVVDTFLSFTAVYPAGSHVKTNRGEIAVVVAQNKEFQDRPVIKIIKDNNGKEVHEEILIDLMKVHNVFIEGVTD